MRVICLVWSLLYVGALWVLSNVRFMLISVSVWGFLCIGWLTILCCIFFQFFLCLIWENNKKLLKKIVVIDKSYQLAVIATIIGVNATVVVYWANTTTHLSTQICASVMSIFSRRRRRRERHDCLWRNFLVVFFLIFISVQRFFFCSFYLALSGAPF